VASAEGEVLSTERIVAEILLDQNSEAVAVTHDGHARCQPLERLAAAPS
jgi:hypothetical protein